MIEQRSRKACGPSLGEGGHPFMKDRRRPYGADVRGKRGRAHVRGKGGLFVRRARKSRFIRSLGTIDIHRHPMELTNVHFSRIAWHHSFPWRRKKSRGTRQSRPDKGERQRCPVYGLFAPQYAESPERRKMKECVLLLPEERAASPATAGGHVRGEKGAENCRGERL